MLSRYFLRASLAANAQTVRDAQITAIRLTIAETVLATNSQLSDRAGPPGKKELTWYADLNERSWHLVISGSAQKGPIQILLTGFLWGDDAGDWIVTYSGAGESAGEPIQINGKLIGPSTRRRPTVSRPISAK